MSLSTLPLSYCTNVHPGRTVAEVIQGLRDVAFPARRQLGDHIAAGLWLSAPVVDDLSGNVGQREALVETLRDGDLVCYTLNAFPYGDFHSTRVKEDVYLPDWTSPERLEYTRRCASLLAEFMPPGTEGSLSTLPLGFEGLERSPDFLDRCADQLLALAIELDRLHDDTGRVVRVAVEPEPCCVLETTAEAIRFFDRMFATAQDRGQLDAARRHLGLCYDVCHQSVEFEDVRESLKRIEAAEIRVNKVHITCALRLEHPAENIAARRQLGQYAEPRYLHQTFARAANGAVLHEVDLSKELCGSPSEQFLEATEWRVHFHVPVDRERLGLLATTRDDLKRALEAISVFPYAPHLEVETYTWGVLPDERPATLVQGLVGELSATFALLDDLGGLQLTGRSC